MLDTLLYAGLSNAVMAVFLAVVTVFGRLARRPALTHALGLLVLLKLVTPPLVPLSLPWPESAPHRPAPIAGTTPAASVSPAVLGGPSMADEPGPLAANVLPAPPDPAV